MMRVRKVLLSSLIGAATVLATSSAGAFWGGGSPFNWGGWGNSWGNNWGGSPWGWGGGYPGYGYGGGYPYGGGWGGSPWNWGGGYPFYGGGYNYAPYGSTYGYPSTSTPTQSTKKPVDKR